MGKGKGKGECCDDDNKRQFTLATVNGSRSCQFGDLVMTIVFLASLITT